VRVERTATIDGDPWSHVMSFSNLTYDANVSAATYEYDPAGNTNVVDYATGVVRFETRRALTANASVPVPRPVVPDGFEFAYGAGIELNTSGVQVIYANENESTALVAGRYVDDGVVTEREREHAEELTVDGHRALYVDLGRSSAVYVFCGEYVNSGAAIGDYPKVALVEFVASMDCGDTPSKTPSLAENGGTGERAAVATRPQATAPQRVGDWTERGTSALRQGRR
jgi:hypothetical protein